MDKLCNTIFGNLYIVFNKQMENEFYLELIQ